MMKIRYLIIILTGYIILIGTAFSRPLVVKSIMDDGMVKQDMHVILVSTILLILVILLEEIIKIMHTILFTNLKNKLTIHLYNNVIKSLFRIELPFFLKKNTSDIYSQIYSDINNVSMLVDSNVMGLVGYLVQFVGGIFGLFFISWRLGLIILLVIPVKILLVKIFAKKKEASVNVWIKSATDFASQFDDTVNGIREIKLWNAYDRKRKALLNQEQKVLDAYKKNALLETYNLSADSILQGMVVVLIYLIGGILICQNSFSIGSLTALITYSGYVLNPVSLALNIKMLFAEVFPSIDRLKKLLKEKKENTRKNSIRIKEFTSNIIFSDIDFHYADKQVLNHVNVKINIGDKVAFVGKNGSGKSTLIQLLLRFLHPQSGCIYLDGTNIDDYDIDDYRELFAVITQDIYLFMDTLWDNITMNKNIPKNKVELLSKKLGVNELIEKCTGGYQHKISRNGSNLSGGEKQKIAILRAFVKDSPIIILDEAMAHIDSKYNSAFNDILKEEFSDKTIIVITHKDSDLKYMNRIYKIDNHTITECEKGA